MKLYDLSVLDTIYTNIELSTEIPEQIYGPANPDGTRPKIRLIATTDDAPGKHVFHVLSKLGEDTDQLMELGLGFGENFMPEDQLAALDTDTEDGMMALLQYERPDWAEPFEIVKATGPLDDGGEWSLTLEGVAPSGASFITAIRHLCSDKMLSRTVAGMMPDVEDEDDMEDEDG